MPARNTIRVDAPDSYYHVYARGVNKEPVFLDNQDKSYFISLLTRYLASEQYESYGRLYPNFSNRVELLAYCLMNNHFHMLLYQNEVGYMSKFMSSLMTSYSRYFNLRYKRSGALFETRFRSSQISDEAYLLHISRYIHLNPRSWMTYEHSSIRYYLYGERSGWLSTDKIAKLFSGTEDYLHFLSDYEDHKRSLELIKSELADAYI